MRALLYSLLIAPLVEEAIGENKTFLGVEELLRSRGVNVEVVQDSRCIEMMARFTREHPELWNEDIGI